MSLMWVKPAAERSWDCHGEHGPCDDCWHMLNANYNPRHVPTIPMKTEFYGYLGLIYIDSLQYGEDDPIMIAAWDGWPEPSPHNLGPHYHHVGGSST